MTDRRTSHTPERSELAVDTIRDRTRICRSGSETHNHLELLGWETLHIENEIALIKAPEWMV